MPTNFWIAVTEFGNSTLLLPAALVLALWLLSARAWRLAGVWALSFGTAVLLVLASKLAFLGWGLGLASIDFTGISGHATVSTSVCTMSAWLATASRARSTRGLAIGCGLLLGLLVSISRLVLQVHSVSEVVAGFALGAVAAGLPIASAWARPPCLAQRWMPLALAGLVLLMPQAVRPAQAHGVVMEMALKASGRLEVYSRAMLHARAAR